MSYRMPMSSKFYGELVIRYQQFSTEYLKKELERLSESNSEFDSCVCGIIRQEIKGRNGR